MVVTPSRSKHDHAGDGRRWPSSQLTPGWPAVERSQRVLRDCALVLAGRCDRCSFEPDAWTDAAAVGDLAATPERWASVLAGVPEVSLSTRTVGGMWSIAEYVDHVRETMFVMRVLLEVAIDTPEVDLGPAVEPTFDPMPRRIDSARARRALADEVRQLCARLYELPPSLWETGLLIGARRVDVHWIVRNALHESRHHLGDVERLRDLAKTSPDP